jgi:hypothetical protein
MSGRAQQNTSSALDKYNKDSRRDAVGKYMRTFARNKTTDMVTAWDDVDYFIVINQQPYFLADSTGNVDSATTISAQLESILDLAWELYFTNANLKDLDATQEAAWKLYFGAALFIAAGLQIQYNFRCYLPAYTESSTVPGDSTNIPYWTQSDFDIFLTSMKDFPIPKGVYEIVDIFFSWIIQTSQEYSQYTIKIPGGYIQPFNHNYDLADFEAARGLMKSNWGNAITHAKKFGLKMGSWRDPVNPTIKPVHHPDCLAMFNHMALEFCDDGTDGSQGLYPKGGFIGGNLVGDYEDVEYYFKDTPNESLLHLFAPWFGIYHGTNNPYGGFILESSAAGEYSLNVRGISQHGTATSALGINDDNTAKFIALLAKAPKDENEEGDVGDWVMSWQGTNLTADQAIDIWLPSIIFNLFKGTGRGATETNNDLINYIGRLLV